MRLIAVVLGWRAAEDVEDGALVVFHPGRSVHFTGPNAWRNAVLLSLKGGSYD